MGKNQEKNKKIKYFINKFILVKIEILFKKFI